MVLNRPLRTVAPPGFVPSDVTFADADDFLALTPPNTYPYTIINHDAIYTNICPGGIMTDPADSTKFLLYVGEFPGNTRTNSRVSVYRGTKTAPYNLARVGVVLEKGVDATNDDENGAAFGSVVVEGVNDYVYYYCGIQGVGAGAQTICRATSTDGITWTKTGQVVVPDGVNEFNLTDPVVKIFGSTYYMYVTGKFNTGLPKSIVIYSSADGISWTRVGEAVGLGASGTTYDGQYIEGCDVIQVGSDYVMLYTCANNGNVWSGGFARATTPNQVTWTKEVIPFFQHGYNGADRRSVAVPLIFNPYGDQWIMFYQGTTIFQPSDTWDLMVAQFTSSPDAFPAGFLSGRGGWSANDFFFDTQSSVNVGLLPSVRALDNTGFANVDITHSISITPGATSSFSVIMQADAVSGALFWGGFTLLETSNVIMRVAFNNSELQYFDNSGWHTLQAVAANTNYTVEVVFTSASTFDINVNGASIVTGQTPDNNIATSVNLLRLEKEEASTRLIYFGDLKYDSGGAETIIDIGN
jgi:hypothetical protein